MSGLARPFRNRHSKTSRFATAASLAFLTLALLAALYQDATFVPELGTSQLTPRINRRVLQSAVRYAQGDTTEVGLVHLNELKPGQELEGVVVNLIKMGAFVDVGAEKHGLVPRNKLQEGFCSNVEEVVSPGDKVTVWVCEATPEKLLLSLVKEKAVRPNPFAAFEAMGASQWLTGKVVDIATFGAFVSVKPPSGNFSEVKGLVHRTKLQDGQVPVVSDVVKVGQDVKVRVIEVDSDARRLLLSMRESDDNQVPVGGADLSLFEKIETSKWLLGVVTSVTAFGVFVAVNPSSDEQGTATGLVHKTQMSPNSAAEKGQQVKVRVLSVDTVAGRMSLSMKHPVQDLSAFRGVTSRSWLTGVVVDVSTFGAVVTVKPPSGKEVEAKGMVHISQMDLDGLDMDAPQTLIGQEVKVRIIGCDEDAGRLSLSMQPPVNSAQDLKPFEGMSCLEWLPGTVTGLSNFGAFVSLQPPSGMGNATGLVHISQIKEGFANTVSEEVQVGQQVKVRVVGVDVNAGRLSLSMKEGLNEGTPTKAVARPPSKTSTPVKVDLSLFVGISASEWLPGTVTSLTNYGAFVDIKPPAGGVAAQGLVHISQISDKFLTGVADEVEVGQEVKVRVIKVDLSEGRMELSMRQENSPSAMLGSKDDLTPWEAIGTSEWIIGTIKSVTNYGVFVMVTPPSGGSAVLGLVHISQLIHNVGMDLAQEFQVGHDIKVRVLSVNVVDGKLALSMREEKTGAGSKPDNLDLSPFKDVDSSEWLTGNVNGVTSFGAFVEVQSPSGDKGEGLVHISQIQDGFVINLRDHMKAGQEVKVRILNVDVDAGKMALSMKEIASTTEPEDLSSFQGIDKSKWFTGKVCNFASFGVFITIPAPSGGNSVGTGLLHLSQMESDLRTKFAYEMQVGQEVQVRVLTVNADTNKMALSMLKDEAVSSQSALGSSQFEGIDSSLWLNGKVSSVQRYGAFVDVLPPSGGEPVPGLVHISCFKNPRLQNVGDEVEIGQEVKVRVTGIDTRGRLSLSMREDSRVSIFAKPNLASFEGIDSSEWFAGRVVSVESSGAVVAVKPPSGTDGTVQGFVHISQMPEFQEGGFVKSVQRKVKAGQDVRVRVLNVDVTTGKLALSMKDAMTTEEAVEQPAEVNAME